jgi:hypothetical protein
MEVSMYKILTGGQILIQAKESVLSINQEMNGEEE